MNEETKVIETPKKERFEFIFTINGNIVCQRYFPIDQFNPKSLASIDIHNTIEDCAYLIDKDLIDKSMIYLDYTAPTVFQNVKEMEKKLSDPTSCIQRIKPGSFIIFREEDDVYVWKGEKATKYEKAFNRIDYLDDSRNDYILKLTFRENGHEVASYSWNGNIYPRFVRSNIDLSNSKNKYKEDDNFSILEASIVDAFNENRENLISKIIEEITEVCSSNEKNTYTYDENFGDKKLPFSRKRMFDSYVKGWEKACKKKTEEYFKRVAR